MIVHFNRKGVARPKTNWESRGCEKPPKATKPKSYLPQRNWQCNAEDAKSQSRKSRMNPQRQTERKCECRGCEMKSHKSHKTNVKATKIKPKATHPENQKNPLHPWRYPGYPSNLVSPFLEGACCDTRQNMHQHKPHITKHVLTIARQRLKQHCPKSTSTPQTASQNNTCTKIPSCMP